jgi:hypothetical protein
VSFSSLTPTEKAFVEGTRQFTKAQQRYMRCRLNKKLRLLNMELTELQKRCSNVAADERAGCNGPKAPVGQAAEWGFNYETVKNKVSPRRDLNARPKVYETFALPAELLGQNMAVSAPRYLMLRAKINIAETSFLI